MKNTKKKFVQEKYVDCPLCTANADVEVLVDKIDPTDNREAHIYCGHCGSLSGFHIENDIVYVVDDKTREKSRVGYLE